MKIGKDKVYKNLFRMRQLYLSFPKVATVWRQLSLSIKVCKKKFLFQQQILLLSIILFNFLRYSISSIFVIPKHFFPKSLSEAPMW